MSQDLVRLKATNNQIAVRHGLPPIGALMTNQYGIEWQVDGHIFVPTLPTLSRQGVNTPDEDDPHDLYPVVIPQNFSPRLMDFLAEVDRCTCKVIMPLDTLPYLRPHSAHPHGHWIDGQTSPHRILMFLDAAHAHETVIAHELAHIWIDVVEDCEDYRVLADWSDTSRITQWTTVQSFVLDNKVNEVIRERGFDMGVIEHDLQDSLAYFVAAIGSGYQPPTRREAAFVASTLATAMLDFETEGTETLQVLSATIQAFQRGLPEVYELACQMASAVRRHGYSDRDSIRRSIDECALLSFAFTGDPLDLETNLVEETPTEEYNDKYPTAFPGWSVPSKLEVFRLMARQRIPAGSDYQVNYSSDGRVQISFAYETGWTEPTILKTIHTLPGSIPVSHPAFSDPKGHLPMNKPTAPLPHSAPSLSGMKPVPPVLPNITNVPMPGRRTYAPGLARFLSEARLAEQLAGEHPYAYAFNNPTTYVDPTGQYAVSKPCGNNSVMITPSKSDTSSIVVGPGGTMLPPSKVFPTLGVSPSADCIAVNGGFFFDPPYRPGKRATPVGNVTDCNGHVYPGSPAPNPIPVVADHGSIIGRPPNKPGGVPGGKVPRTGACVDKSGKIGAIIAIGPPGTTFGGLTQCMTKNCPPGSQFVLLDGGGSTQVIQNGRPPHPYPGFGGQNRPVHNWIVICR